MKEYHIESNKWFSKVCKIIKRRRNILVTDYYKQFNFKNPRRRILLTSMFQILPNHREKGNSFHDLQCTLDKLTVKQNHFNGYEIIRGIRDRLNEKVMNENGEQHLLLQNEL